MAKENLVAVISRTSSARALVAMTILMLGVAQLGLGSAMVSSLVAVTVTKQIVVLAQTSWPM